jgi:hypothetical protein
MHSRKTHSEIWANELTRGKLLPTFLMHFDIKFFNQGKPLPVTTMYVFALCTSDKCNVLSRYSILAIPDGPEGILTKAENKY